MPPLTDTVIEKIPHYHGDYVRQLMLAGVALMLIASPMYVNSYSAQIPFIVFGAIIVVGLAAITNPRRRSIFVINSAITGALAAIYGLWGLFGYPASSMTTFVLRVAIALLFLFAFYFSMKTLRAMILHDVGRPDEEIEREVIQEENIESDGSATVLDKQEPMTMSDKNLPYEDDEIDIDENKREPMMGEE